MLRRRLLAERNLPSVALRYHSVRQPLSTIIDSLQRQIADSAAERVHLVGHSLGGLIIMRTLQRYRSPKIGRVVLLGSPMLGSRAAQRFDWLFTRVGSAADVPGLGQRLLGPTVVEELLQTRERRWELPYELGIIAGTHARGLGRVLVNFGERNDGTAAVSETRLPGAKSHLELPVSHMGLLLSARVARETGSFLDFGCFGR